ncbi:MAG: cyclic nucleotide-binding domain-containing protein [Alphaproteobacteria bacterium]|nr:cyclic nucleotide-binding domain-containing protein [Alphaproteobacteria bacterium]
MLEKEKVIIRKEYFEGVAIFNEGDEALEAFVIEKGEVEIFRAEDGVRQQIAIIGEGDTLGEMALIKGVKHSSSAVAHTKTRLAVISKKMMDEKISQCDPLIKTMLYRFVDRLQKSNTDKCK